MTDIFYAGLGQDIDTDAAWDYIHNGYVLPPQTVLKGRTKRLAPLVPVVSPQEDELPVLLEQTLEKIIGPAAGARRGVMFTGGFDSVLLALLMRRCEAQVTAVTVRFEDFNPLTVAGARRVAGEMEMAQHILTVKAAEFLSAFEALAGITEEPLLDLDLAVVYAALKKYDPGITGNVLVSGMGSDQWFGDESLTADPDPVAREWPMLDSANAHQRVAQVHGCAFLFPFLNADMRALSQYVPPAMKTDKKMLRRLPVAGRILDMEIKREVQVPPMMRQMLVNVYGARAWPEPVTVRREPGGVNNSVLRQIVLGLWLEKANFRKTT